MSRTRPAMQKKKKLLHLGGRKFVQNISDIEPSQSVASFGSSLLAQGRLGSNPRGRVVGASRLHALVDS